MDSCLVVFCVVAVGCIACVLVEHGRAIMVMLGIQSDERE